MSWFSNSKNESIKSSNTISTNAISSSIPSSLLSELDKLNIVEERLKRYVDEADTLTSDATLTSDMEDDLRAKAISLREKGISKALDNIKNSMKVDLCFVLDCSGSMEPHIAAAKDCILQVSDYVKNSNPNIELWVGFCGYRDHSNGSDRLQVFDFTDQYEQFIQYVSSVSAIPNLDNPEDVLGGLDAAITKMNWQNGTRVLLHIGDYPPHGRRYIDDRNDIYPNGDPYGLTAETVLEKMKSKNIIYFFGKITNFTDKMIKVFSSIIGEFPVFDLVGEDPIKLIDKFVKAATSSITQAVSLTSTIGSSSQDIYSLKQKKIDMNPDKPNWNKLPLQKGVVMWYFVPRTLDELKNLKYFNKSKLFSRSFSFKIASQPFSAGSEKCAYFALGIKSSRMHFIVKQEEKFDIVIKEYIRVEGNDPFEKYLGAVEISTIAYFLSTEFNLIAEQKKIPKVYFLNVKLLRSGTVDRHTRYYTIEPDLKKHENAEYKRFNTNTGVVTELRPVLEAFAHFTYEYTEGYLVVCDLQGIELNDEFILTDPAIHCVDPLRFGRTNFGQEGINQCFLVNHKCNDICKKLKLCHVDLK